MSVPYGSFFSYLNLFMTIFVLKSKFQFTNGKDLSTYVFSIWQVVIMLKYQIFCCYERNVRPVQQKKAKMGPKMKLDISFSYTFSFLGGNDNKITARQIKIRNFLKNDPPQCVSECGFRTSSVMHLSHSKQIAKNCSLGRKNVKNYMLAKSQKNSNAKS